MATPARPSARHPLDAVVGVARGLAAGSDPQSAIRDMLREVIESTGATAGGVFVSDRRGVLVPAATSSPMLARDFGPLPVRVAQTRQPAMLTGREEVQPFLPRGASAVSALGVPVHDVRGGFGSLVLFSERGFAPGALNTAGVYGDFLSLALRIGRVEREAGAHQKGVEALSDAGRAFVGLLDLEAVLARTLDGAESLLGSTGGFVCLVDEQSASLRLGLFRWVSRDAVRAVMAHDRFADILRETAPRVVRDAAPYPMFAPLATGASDRVGLVAVPLRADRTTACLLVTMLP